MASKQRRQPKASKAQMTVESMRNIFDDSQRLDKHQTCIQRLTDLQELHSKTNQSITNFYKELVRNIKYTLWVHDWRSPYGQNSINFIIKYMLAFGQTAEEDNEELRHEFIDTILEDVVIPYTNSKKAECRINACHFIRRLSDELVDINEDIYEKIRKALLDRSIDRIASVRAAAILALHRFQDKQNPNDVVIQAIQFHLNFDPDYEVRHNSLKAMVASQSSSVRFIDATLDIKDFIRKTAYIQISEKLPIKWFKIDGRLTILKNGLKDRSPAVQKVVESVLIPSWVKSCNNDLIELLVALDIQTDIELIEKMLDIYFKHLNKEKLGEDSNRTKFIQLAEEFRDKNLAKEKVFSVSINVENVFLWRYLCEFCKTNQIESQIFITTENKDQNPTEVLTEEQTLLDVIEMDDQIPEEAVDEPRVQKVDLFDLLVPDVPYFCAYLENFINNVTKEELNITDALDYEFIFNQFMKVALLLDIDDEAQRKTLSETMHTILLNNNIGDKFHGYITPVMKCLAKKGFADNHSYLDFTVELISEIFASILIQTAEENETIVDDSTRELEEKRDQMIADIEKCKIEAQKLENETKLSEAEEMFKKMDALELEVKSLRQKITINTLAQSLSQSSQTSQSINSISFTDHPKTQMQCLHIFSGCLEFGVFNEVNAVMQTHIEKVCLPGILSDNSKIRCVATRCLGLVCLTSPQYFKKYLHLLIEIFSKDIDSIKLIGLQSIFDSLCEHGINIFENKNKDSEGGDEPQVETPFDDNDDDFITSLKKFFATQLDSENDEIRRTAAQGVSKLLIHCRMYSPELLSKLIIIWFTPNENPIIVQFIGDFLRLYSLAESQGVIVGQTALEEAFVITLQTIYDNNLRLNCDNLIKFFLKLIADESHVKLADDLVVRMIETDSENNKLIEDYLLSAVCQLNLIEMEAKDLKRFEENIRVIEERLENSKSKKVKQKLSAIKTNIENRRQQSRADSKFAEDFRSVDENDEDLDISDRSQDLNNDKQNIGSDSDADSFRTCPESPLQKRRRMSEMLEPNESTNPTISSEIPLNEDIDTEVNETIVSEIAITEDNVNEMNPTIASESTAEDNDPKDNTNITPEVPIIEDMDIEVNPNSISEQLIPETIDMEVNQTITSGLPSVESNHIEESVAQNNQINQELSQTLSETIEEETDQQID